MMYILFVKALCFKVYLPSPACLMFFALPLIKLKFIYHQHKTTEIQL